MSFVNDLQACCSKFNRMTEKPSQRYDISQSQHDYNFITNSWWTWIFTIKNCVSHHKNELKNVHVNNPFIKGIPWHTRKNVNISTAAKLHKNMNEVVKFYWYEICLLSKWIYWNLIYTCGTDQQKKYAIIFFHPVAVFRK